jgi:hypothetical protein
MSRKLQLENNQSESLARVLERFINDANRNIKVGFKDHPEAHKGQQSLFGEYILDMANVAAIYNQITNKDIYQQSAYRLADTVNAFQSNPPPSEADLKSLVSTVSAETPNA